MRNYVSLELQAWKLPVYHAFGNEVAALSTKVSVRSDADDMETVSRPLYRSEE